MGGYSETEAPPATACWRCAGKGYRPKKVQKSEAERNTTKGIHQVVDEPCSVCKATGLLHRNRAKKEKPYKQFEGWKEPGPDVPEMNKTSLKLGGREELSSLLGKWKIIQNIDHHKYSTDDIVTAWVAYRVGKTMKNLMASDCTSRVAEPPKNLRFLDIGCGLGSVLLMNAWMHPTAPCIGIEAQPGRMSLAKRSVDYNGVSSRVMVLHGDLRNAQVVQVNAGAIRALHESYAGNEFKFPSVSASEEPLGSLPASSVSTLPHFDLITGTPPYFDVKQGGLPPDENSARCLFEYRGGIEAYCLAAKQYLAPHGLFVVCETALALERGYEAAEAAGLEVVARLDAKPKTDKAPLFIVYVMAHKSGPWTQHIQEWRREHACRNPTTATENDDTAATTTAPTDATSAFPCWQLPSDVFVSRSASDQEDLPHPDMRTSEYADALGVRLKDGASARQEEENAEKGANMGKAEYAEDETAPGKNEEVAVVPPKAKQATRGLHVDFAGKPLVWSASDTAEDNEEVQNGGEANAAPGAKRERSSVPSGEDMKRNKSKKPSKEASREAKLAMYHGLEIVRAISVREASNARTIEYKTLLWEMGKPG